jgi:ribosomal protein S18 acetylase RimI-like enzyme
MTRAWVATAEDAAAVTGLMLGFRDHLGSAGPSDADARASVERLLADPDTELLLAADGDGPPAGVLQLRFRWSFWKTALDAWIEDLFVDAGARRSGLGDALVRLAFDRARERGAARIELDCFEDNAPALALYERNGFDPRHKGAARSLLLGRQL